MGLEKLKSWLVDTDEFELEEDEVTYEDSDTNERPTLKRSQPTNEKLVLFEPRSYGETSEIADKLALNKGVIVNLHRLNKDQSKRVVDFLSGVIYALKGNILVVDTNIYLCVPKSMKVSGEIELTNEE